VLRVSGPQRIPFSDWAPIPRRIFRELARGESTLAEYRVEGGLYEAASRSSTWVAEFRDLKELADRLGWEHSLDHLSKTLRRLRERGRIAFDSRPGRTSHRYEINVLYDRPERSEHGPSRDEEAGPSRPDGGGGMVEPPGAPAGSSGSEQARAASGADGPSRAGAGPSSGGAAKAGVERDSGTADTGPVRAPRDVTREANPLYEESEDPAASRRDSRARAHAREAGPPVDRLAADLEELTRRRAAREEVAWPDTTGLAVEDAIVADADALVAEGLARWVDPPALCRYESHREAGCWRTGSSRLACRICHAPAPAAEDRR
jgi:hypothetical protein